MKSEWGSSVRSEPETCSREWEEMEVECETDARSQRNLQDVLRDLGFISQTGILGRGVLMFHLCFTKILSQPLGPDEG